MTSIEPPVEPSIGPLSEPVAGIDQSPPEALGKRERNKLDKQRRIVAAATALFQAKGFDETTTAEIAEAADIGAGTLYLYVDSKEDLLVSAFVDVAGQAWADAFDQVDPTDPLPDQIMALFRHVTEHHNRDRRLARSFFKEIPYTSPKVRAGTVGFNDWFNARLELLLCDAAAAGQLDPAVPRDALGMTMYALWQYLMRALSTDSTTKDQMLKHLEAGVRATLWGIT